MTRRLLILPRPQGHSLGQIQGLQGHASLFGRKEAVEGEDAITDIDEKTLQDFLYYHYTGKLSGGLRMSSSQGGVQQGGCTRSPGFEEEQGHFEFLRKI